MADELKYLPFKFERKALAEDGEFEGFGSTFGNEDLGGDIVVEGAFTKSLKRHTKNGTLPAMLLGHDSTKQIGDFTEMEEVGKGLKLKGKLWIDGANPDPDAMKAYRSMKGTSTKGLSIGFRTIVSDIDPKGRRMLKELELGEVSYTIFPMNPKATVTRVKSLLTPNGSLVDIRTAEEILRDAGLSHKQAKALLSGGYKAMLHRDDADAVAEDILGTLKEDRSIAVSGDELLDAIKSLSNAYKA